MEQYNLVDNKYKFYSIIALICSDSDTSDRENIIFMALSFSFALVLPSSIQQNNNKLWMMKVDSTMFRITHSELLTPVWLQQKKTVSASTEVAHFCWLVL